MELLAVSDLESVTERLDHMSIRALADRLANENGGAHYSFP